MRSDHIWLINQEKLNLPSSLFIRVNDMNLNHPPLFGIIWFEFFDDLGIHPENITHAVIDVFCSFFYFIQTQFGFKIAIAQPAVAHKKEDFPIIR